MDFTQPFDYSDVTFIIENRKIYANKAVLAMSSDVFKAMFTPAFMEKMPDIPMPDKKFDDFLELMQILHPPHTKLIDATNVHCILPLVHEYQITHVFEICVQTLLEAPPSILTLNMAEKYNLPQLYSTCLKYAKETPLAELKNTDGFTAMNSQTLIEVLTDKVERLEPCEQAQVAANGRPPGGQGMCPGSGHLEGSDVTCPACIQYSDHF